MNRRYRLLVIGIFAAIGVIFFLSAWVGDDTYITMRVVDNAVHGHGLRWNIDERVQVYTHPLWMLLLMAGYVATHNAFVTIVSLSLFAALASLAIFLHRTPKTLPALFACAILLGLSRSFVDFSVSGMENPLTHILLLLFLSFLFHSAHLFNREIFILAVWAGLATLNRMDVILLFLPALVYVFLARPSLRTFGLIAGGFAPFLIWEIFSFIYYGFFLPNTYYAKLNTGIPLVVLMRQGLVYFSDSLSTDPITLAVIALASLFAIMRQGRRERAVALGVMLYLLYILYIGGDFMSGRFFSAPYLASAFLLVRHLNGLRNRYAWLAASLLLALGLSASRPTFILPGRQDAEKAAADFETYGVADIKARAFQTSSLLVWRPGVQIFPNEKVTRRGMRYRDEQRKVAVDGTVGLVGFFGGPQLHLIDGYALADPLLARLPVMKSAKWLPAHFPREIPAGYLETIASGENRIQNPDLALYYDKLRLIISGDLWTQERWEAIWKMNTGQYDYLLQNYLASSNN